MMIRTAIILAAITAGVPQAGQAQERWIDPVAAVADGRSAAEVDGRGESLEAGVLAAPQGAAGKGFKIGAIAGGVVGAGLGAFAGILCERNCEGVALSVIGTGGLMALIGGALGAIIGSASQGP